MALGSYQKISRVLSGKPFGDGSDGALTISSDTTQSPVDETCTGSSGSKNLTCGSTTLTNGDVVLIHQSRTGANVGKWEINRVASGGGTVNIVLQENLANTYSAQAQAIKIPMYSSVTVNESITWTGKAWGGTVGGILLWACNGTTTITGAISVNGSPSLNRDAITTGGGFRGSKGDSTDTAKQGEGTAGNGSESNAANGNGGGGGTEIGGGGSGGGGGGNGTAGATGGIIGNGPTAGTGGSTAGVAELTNMVFGGAGGGGCSAASDAGGGGGSGGGIVCMFTKILAEITGSTTATGGAGGTGSGSLARNGGAGAGGSVLIQAQIATLGTNKITSTGGTNANGGGVGGVGRIAVHYSGSVSGTTNPTFDDSTDSSLVETTEDLASSYSYFM